jgi:hypothetical protein
MRRIMFRTALAILGITIAIALGSCATTQRLSAAGDVHALLVSIRENDRQAFEAHIDRDALEAQLAGRLQDGVGRANVPEEWRGVASILAGPISQIAGEALIRPEVFRAVAEQYGYGPDRPIPSSFAVATMLKSLPDGRVCAPRKKNGPCLLTFAEEGGTWRLVSFDGDTKMLRRRGG